MNSRYIFKNSYTDYHMNLNIKNWKLSFFTVKNGNDF